jgi:hypothetical protein
LSNYYGRTAASQVVPGIQRAIPQIDRNVQSFNERLLGGLGRTAIRTGEFVLPGKTENISEAAIRRLFPEAGSAAGRRGLTPLADPRSFGGRLGTGAKAAVDVAGIVLPSTAATKGLQATQLAQRGMQGGRLARLGTIAATEAVGGIPASLASIAQARGQQKPLDLKKEIGIGLAIDAATPLGIKLLGKGYKAVRGAISNVSARDLQAATKAVQAAPTPRPIAENVPISKLGAKAEKIPQITPVPATQIRAINQDMIQARDIDRLNVGNVAGLSQSAKNSLPNKPVGIKPNAIARARDEILSGNLPPVKVEVTDLKGGANIIDGRHHLEAARQLGITNYPIDVVPNKFSKQLGVPTGEFLPAAQAKVARPIYETVPSSAMRPKAPKGGKERGFIKTVTESPMTEQPTQTLLKQADGTYTVKSNKVLIKQARERITANVADAKTYAMTQTDDQAVATAGELIKYYQAKGDYGQAAEVASQAARRLTEAGREIQAASLYNRLSPDGILQYASNKMQKVGKKLDPEAAEILTDMAKKIETMPDGEAKQVAIKELLDEVGRTQGSALNDKIITLWKAGLLTSPITTAGNLTSNTIKQIVKKTVDDPVAAVADMMIGLATGKRTKTFTIRGLGEGGVEGLKRGAKYLKTGYDPRDPISKLDQKDVYFSKGFLGKIAKGYTDTVFRSLGAQDQPYFYAALKNTLYDEALAAAKNQGVKGAVREKFIKDFINNPDTKILDQATEEARTAVFQNKTFLGDIAARITQSNNPAVRTVGQFVMPFSRVPSAVATEIFQRTPLGAAKEVVSQIYNVAAKKGAFDQRALVNALSKSTTGTIGLMGLGYALDRGGNINLAMPTSQAEQNLWQQEGRQPFSIKIGDKYYSMNYIQPFGTLIAMGAQYNRSLREGGSQQDALSASVAMGAKAVTEQSFLRGVSGVLSALQDPSRYAERFTEQTAGSIIPNIVRTTARAIDPLQREITSAGEAVIAGIPGLRQRLQPKVDVFGQPIARPADAINTLFNPLRPTTAKSTPQIDEVRRLFNQDKNVIPSEIDKNAFGKANPINQQQINNLKTAMGNAVLDKYQQIIADPRYANLSDEQKAKALKDAKDAAIQGEKFRFAQANNLPYTAQDKLDKDTVAYLEGQEKDYIQATLPKPPKVKVSKARRGRRATGRRRGGRGRVAKVRVKAPKVPRVSVKGLPSAPKAKKVSFKVPKPKATARKSIKIKTG